MDITQKKLALNTLKLTAHIKESDYHNSVENSLLNYRKKMTVPGFRQGKVPMSLVRKKYELSVKVEEINKLLSSSIQNYIADNKISILGNPLPIENEVDFINSRDYNFEFEIGLQPKVDISSVEKSKVSYYVITPDKQEIQNHLLSLQKRYGSVKSFDTIENGDMLNISLQELTKDDQVNSDGLLTKTSILTDKIDDKKTQNKLLKLKKGEQLKIDVKKSFSNETDLASMLKIEKDKLANINSNFMCTINDVSRLIPANLDVDFFKKVYPSKDIKTKQEFKIAVTEELAHQYDKESDKKLFNDASSMFVEKVKIDFPTDFLKKWLKTNIKKEFTEKEFETEFQNYLKYLSWQLIENTICIENKIKITDDQLKEFTKSYVLQQMKNYGGVNMGNKELDGIVANILKNKKESEKMMNEVILIELVEYFKSKMKIEKKEISLNDFIKLANNQK